MSSQPSRASLWLIREIREIRVVPVFVFSAFFAVVPISALRFLLSAFQIPLPSLWQYLVFPKPGRSGAAAESTVDE